MLVMRTQKQIINIVKDMKNVLIISVQMNVFILFKMFK